MAGPRYLTHLGVLVLIGAAFVANTVQLPPALALDSFGRNEPVVEESADSASLPLPQPASVLALTKAAVLHTTIPERVRGEVTVYEVQPGDTLLGIAQKFGISGETVMWANGQDENPDVLSIGQEMTILPVSGVYHTVGKKDTLEKIAAQYKVDVSAITGSPANHMKPPYQISAGQKLVVPGGEKPFVAKRIVHNLEEGTAPADAAKGGGIFGWPTSGTISQKFWSGHRALDISGKSDSPIYAADGGFVAMSGWSNAGYGNLVLLDHGNGFQTLYAHLDKILVRAGQSVKKGQKIGLMGCTGRCTGTHLHFEVRKAGVARNPVGVLP